MEAVFQVDAGEETIPRTPTSSKNGDEIGISQVPMPSMVTRAPNNPTLMDYAKEELQLVMFQPTTEMFWSFIGDTVDSVCGVDKTLVLEETEMKPIYANPSPSYTPNTSPRSSIIPPELRGGNNLATESMIKVVSSEQYHEYKDDLSSGNHLKNASNVLVPPPSIHRVDDFKHIQLPQSVYVMAAAYDIQRAKESSVNTDTKTLRMKTAAKINSEWARG